MFSLNWIAENKEGVCSQEWFWSFSLHHIWKVLFWVSFAGFCCERLLLSWVVCEKWPPSGSGRGSEMSIDPVFFICLLLLLHLLPPCLLVLLLGKVEALWGIWGLIRPPPTGIPHSPPPPRHAYEWIAYHSWSFPNYICVPVLREGAREWFLTVCNLYHHRPAPPFVSFSRQQLVSSCNQPPP